MRQDIRRDLPLPDWMSMANHIKAATEGLLLREDLHRPIIGSRDASRADLR